MSTQLQITITEKAADKVREFLAAEDDAELSALRVAVQGGGCSGFQYGFTFDSDTAEDDFNIDGILIDSMSMQYLQGAKIDYQEDITGSQFVIKNPNAQSTCGCGSSFSV